MFEKTLSDLVRGIRAHKANEHQYISQCMTEIKKELKQENISVKANAVSKLTYLQMLGYDITWAAFNIIEVMSSTKFTYKRIGYLAATQCFHDSLDVVMLTTNMIRKDISSHNQYDSSLALNGLACFMTPDLARDLANDVLTLMSSSRPYLRKKGILTMYKVFVKFPDALRPAFPRLKERLEDPDPGVQSASVSVICELARKNPRNYLSLAPVFFKLMTNSTNNWMLIKIIKLFGSLTPLEPRLGKKLIEPLTNLIHSTTAMSLLYECVSTVIVGIPHHTASIQLCVSKLRLFIEDADQNLKYLGLLAMAKILEHQPKVIQQHKDLVVECLDDRDDSIRLRALDLIAGMVSKKNLMEITKKLISHMDDSESASYRDEVLSKIILICSQNNYQYITNFEWYITVLVEMTKFEGTRHGKLIASQMLDVSIRVKDVRSFAVRQMSTILENTHLFTGTTQNHGICEVLYAAAWIVGEFSEHLTDPRSTLDSLLNPKVVALPPHIQAVFVQNIVKLYASILVKAEAEGTLEALEEVGGMLVEKLPVFIQSGDLEVQERACCILQLMKYIVKLQSKGAAIGDELMALFEGDLNPVAPKAQKKVPVPEGLDLDKWIYEPPPESEEDNKDDNLSFLLPSGGGGFGGASGGGAYGDANHSPTGSPKDKKKRKKRSKQEQEEEEEMKKRREQRLQDQLSNPHYLKPSATSSRASGGGGRAGESTGLTESSGLTAIDASKIPVQKLELGIGLIIKEPKMSPVTKKKKKKRRGKKGRRGDSSEEEEHVPRPVVDTSMGEMPEGALASDEEGKANDAVVDDLSKALDQNLDMPLRDDEVLPVRQHRIVPSAAMATEEEEPKKKDKRKKKKGEDVEEAGGEEKGEGKKKKKKRSKKTTAAIEEDEQGGGKEDEGPSLIDIGSKETSPAPAAALAAKTESPRKKSPAREAKKEGDIDDLEFWLSTDMTPAKQTTSTEPAATTEDTPTKTSSKKRSKKKGRAKTEPTPEVAPVISTVMDEPEGGEGGEAREEEEGKRRKKKGEKGKREKSSKKSKKAAAVAVEDDQPSEAGIGGGASGEGGGAAELFDLDMGSQQKQEPVSRFQVLAEDENLKMTYEVRANPLFSQQVTVAVIFHNQTANQLVSLDFNVLDSLNTKLDRPMGTSAHEGIKVPFQLPPGQANECQFTFYVQSFLMPQKLRGTLTYMVKSEQGTSGEKIDFKVQLPCSAFICPVPCAQQQFASLLSGGTLTDKQTIKVQLSNTGDFGSALVAIAAGLHLGIVEHIEESASLYGCSISNHHICLLVKSLGNNTLSVSAKGTDSQLISNLLDELKALV